MPSPVYKTATVLLACLSAASVLLAQRTNAISADGPIESKDGGFVFPDGTVQETSAIPSDPCPTLAANDEMVEVAGVCIDKYEASLWDAPIGGNVIPNTDPVPCTEDGQNCTDIYARSVAGVEPRRFITWFQAQQALANSGKRFLTNTEWQLAVAGTPDSLPCNVVGAAPAATGSAPTCISNWGILDMVGNVREWIGDWVPHSTDCPGWGAFSADSMCLAGASENDAPGALVRGGYWSGGGQGPLSVIGTVTPDTSQTFTGFRGAR